MVFYTILLNGSLSMPAFPGLISFLVGHSCQVITSMREQMNGHGSKKKYLFRTKTQKHETIVTQSMRAQFRENLN